MTTLKSIAIGTIATLALTAGVFAQDAGQRWTPEHAKSWYGRQRWLVGANFVPKSAINELEMWQADTFDPGQIDTELGWAEKIGMNTMRVFLHDLLWQQDAEGFKKRIDTFLGLCAKHKIKPLLVLFDSCWDPNPQLGKQRDPRPGVHNSGWVKSPGDHDLQDPAKLPHFEAYTKGVVGAFAKDDRILGWDLWNEPDNHGGGKYDHLDEAKRIEIVGKLLPQVFAWARSVNPTQPLTSGPWHNDSWAPGANLNAVEKAQLDNSDVLTFHSYDPPAKFQQRLDQLKPYDRPMICTEYMARPLGSTFADILPVARKNDVGMINWGFVQGKSQTNMPWDSWDRPYVTEPPKVWFHDLFKPDGTPYRAAETTLIRRMTAEAEKNAAGPAKVSITVDTSDAPELAAFGETIKAIGQAEYPKIAALLASPGYTPAEHVTITFRRDYKGVAECAGDRIKGSVKWFTEHPDDTGAFVHELVHVVQHYTAGERPGWLTEGIADYYRWFVYEPENKRPHANPRTAKYDGSYGVTAQFLVWCQRQYDKDLVRKLNAACREARYTDALWQESTGKSLADLGEEWQKSLSAKSSG